ncbi:MAG: ABC transporter permease [Myxococcaceae bacterium]
MSASARLDALLERAADRLNPIVIKEVRQGLRTKSFWVFFALMLFACLVISLIAFAAQSQDDIGSSGAGFFLAYFSCLGVVHFFVIPYTAYRSLAREREDETWVLLTLTGLGPRRILLGKVGSFVTQAALYGSAAGPFLLFSYYLNGIDLPTILVVLVLGGAYQAFLTSMAVSAATLAEGRIGRAAMHFAVLGFLLFAAVQGLGLAFSVAIDGHSVATNRDFPVVVGLGLWVMLSYGALLFEAAASRLSLATENYTRGLRGTFVLQLVVSAGIFGLVWHSNGRDPDPVEVAQAVFCLHLAIAGLFVATDVDGAARRHRPALGLFSFFRPGALRGFRLVMVALALSTALWSTLLVLSMGSVTDRRLLVLLAEGAYVALYLSAPLLVSRLLPIPSLRTPAATRLLFLLILLVGAGLPPLASALARTDPALWYLNVLNPTLGLLNIAEHEVRQSAVWLLGAVALLVTFGADRALAWRDRPPGAGSPA